LRSPIGAAPWPWPTCWRWSRARRHPIAWRRLCAWHRDGSHWAAAVEELSEQVGTRPGSVDPTDARRRLQECDAYDVLRRDAGTGAATGRREVNPAPDPAASASGSPTSYWAPFVHIGV
jgi:hypothetical protein